MAGQASRAEDGEEGQAACYGCSKRSNYAAQARARSLCGSGESEGEETGRRRAAALWNHAENFDCGDVDSDAQRS